MAPTLQMIGAYKLPVDEELILQQMEILYGDDLGDDERRDAFKQSQEQLESVVLLEILVTGKDKSFDVGDFTQAMDDEPRENWQCAYSEVFLNGDGQNLLSTQDISKITEPTFRVAFYLHFFQPGKPLLTSYGDLKVPSLVDMPERLSKLSPYEPVG